MYIARNKSGSLMLFNNLPSRMTGGYWQDISEGDLGYEIDSYLYDINFDDEPIEVCFSEVSRNNIVCPSCGMKVFYTGDDVKSDEDVGEYGADIVMCPKCNHKITINLW